MKLLTTQSSSSINMISLNIVHSSKYIMIHTSTKNTPWPIVEFRGQLTWDDVSDFWNTHVVPRLSFSTAVYPWIQSTNNGI